MHITGKIFAFLTLCLAVAAIIYTAKTLDVQNEWNRRVAQARDGYQTSTERLPEVRQQSTQLEEELAMTRLQWGRYWDDVDTNASPNLARGLINVNIGRNDDLVRETDDGEILPTLYAFQKSSDGSSEYVGEFRVVQVDVNRAALQLNRAPRAGETDNWNFSESWRFRNSIPSAMRQSESELLLKMTIMEQKIRDRVQSLTIQQESVASARKALQNRMQELEGNPNAPEGAGPEFQDGLVATLKTAEKNRNAALAEVQQLRIELNQLFHQFEQLVADNAAIENALRSKTKTAANLEE